MNCLSSCAESGKNCSAASSTFLMPNLASLLVANCNQLFRDCILIFPWPDTELGVTTTLKSDLEQQQTILNFHLVNRHVNDWNSLPNSFMSASGLNSFKILLLNYLCK